MKKSLLALAVLGAFTGTAFAQSSVSIYGRFDIGLVNTKTKTGSLAAATTLKESTWAIDSDSYAGSRIGFKGTEDLGGGLSAVFTLENGYAADRGTLGQGGRLFGRQAWAGFAGDFGLVVAGRAPIFSSGTGALDTFSPVDPFGSGYKLAAFGVAFISPGVTIRADNAIAYVSPNLSGFKAGVAYSTQLDGAEVAGGSSRNTTAKVGSLSYSAGPLYVVLTYDNVQLPENAGTGYKPKAQTHLYLGGTYDLGVVKLHAAYGKEKAIRISTIAQENDGRDASPMMVGISAPAGGGKIMASYQIHNGKSMAGTSAVNGAATASAEYDRSAYGLGYMYPLSKRTQVHAIYASAKGKKDIAREKFTTAQSSYDQTQLNFGVSHTF